MSRILIVEDDIASGEILVKRLQHQGHQVELVESGEQAQETLLQQLFDMVVVDLALPGIDGWRLLHWMFNEQKMLDTKTVAITAYYEPSIAIRAKEAGFLHCFPKPATQSFVLELQRLIDSARQ